MYLDLPDRFIVAEDNFLLSFTDLFTFLSFSKTTFFSRTFFFFHVNNLTKTKLSLTEQVNTSIHSALMNEWFPFSKS